MDIPRELIYEDRSSLEDFRVNDEGTLNKLLYDNYLIETTDLCQGEANIVNRILKVFNDAYFVCTIVLMQPKDIFGLSYYIERVDNPHVVFPMVYLYLSKVNSDSIIISRIQKPIMSEVQRVNDWNRNYEFINKIDNLYDGSIDSAIFAPRKITPELLSKINWHDATDCFNKDCIKKVVIDVCRNREDWHMMVDAIKASAQKYDYDFGFEDYIEEGIDEDGRYQRTIKVPKDPYDSDGNDILEPLKRAGVYQYCDDIKEMYDELSIDAPKTIGEVTKKESYETNLVQQRIIEDDKEVPREVPEKWIDCFDSVFNENINAQEVFNALREFSSPVIIGKPYYYTIHKVLTEIRWIPNKKGSQQDFLKWYNLHFKCGWKANWQFKFTDIDHRLKKIPSSEWDEHTMTSSLGKDYHDLAQRLKDTFTETVNGGKLIDRLVFIKKGMQRINNGY